MLFPLLGAHMSGSEFQYSDLSWKDFCGQMANLVGNSGCNKGRLSNLVEAICLDFRRHDEGELKKPGGPPSDLTTAAFLQNAQALGKKSSTIVPYRPLSSDRRRKMLYLCTRKQVIECLHPHFGGDAQQSWTAAQQ